MAATNTALVQQMDDYILDGKWMRRLPHGQYERSL